MHLLVYTHTHAIAHMHAGTRALTHTLIRAGARAHTHTGESERTLLETAILVHSAEIIVAGINSETSSLWCFFLVNLFTH
jgi:hypothetical protein